MKNRQHRLFFSRQSPWSRLALFCGCCAGLLLSGAFAETFAQLAPNTPPPPPQDEDLRVVKLNARQGRGRRDANIAKPKPRRAVGDARCRIEIKNNTTSLVYVYLNDRPDGSIRRGGTYRGESAAGRIKIYTRTDRQNFNFLYWGPNYYTCGSRQKDGSVTIEVND